MQIGIVLRGVIAVAAVAALGFAAQPLQAAEEENGVCTPGASTCCKCTKNIYGHIFKCESVAQPANYECHTGVPGSCSTQACLIW